MDDLVLLCFPGHVLNVDKALKCIGGIDALASSVTSEEPLCLTYHPLNKYCKGIIADKDSDKSLLIRVDHESMDYHIVGRIGVKFNFKRLCDFQYLPLLGPEDECKTSSTEYIYRNILPSELPSPSWMRQNPESTVYFAQPCRFSEPIIPLPAPPIDSTIYYSQDDNNAAQAKPIIVNALRKKYKRSYAIMISHSDQHVPEKPIDLPSDISKKGREYRRLYQQVSAAFELKPIWSRTALMYNLKIMSDLKHLLPMFAYFFNSGPWRHLWVKYGYDPRRNSEAAIYQTITCKIRIKDIKSKISKVVTKRMVTPVSTEKAPECNAKGIRIPKYLLHENCYILKPNEMPPARTMMYQLCDIHIPEVQLLIKKCNQFYDSKTGWYSRNVIDKCRDLSKVCLMEAIHYQLCSNSDLKTATNEEAPDQNEEPSDTYYNSMLNYVTNAKSCGQSQNINRTPSSSIAMEYIDLLSDSDGEEYEEEDADEEQDPMFAMIQQALPNKINSNIEDNLMQVDEENCEDEYHIEEFELDERAIGNLGMILDTSLDINKNL